MKRAIGLTGVAGAGKDLFFKLISKRLPVRRFALADLLKVDVQTWCIDRYGIDPTDCDREAKEKIREFLVFHGTFQRKKSKGQFWIDKLDHQIKSFLTNAITDGVPGVPCVTDIRYQEYERDEVTWLKNDLNGVLVHISQRTIPTGVRFAGETAVRPPANREEAKHDPILRGMADYSLCWPRVTSEALEEDGTLNSEAEKFVNWYKKA